MLASTSGIPDRRVDELLELVGIPAAARKRAGGYSMGMRQRLGLAAALLGDPRAVILDEPANGLDPEGIRWLRGFLRHLSSEGKTVLISSHLLQEVAQTVDDVVIIANGRSVAQGPISDLQGEPTVLVRTPRRDELSSALVAGGMVSEHEGTRRAAGADPRHGPGRRHRPARRGPRARAARPLAPTSSRSTSRSPPTRAPQPQRSPGRRRRSRS